MATPTAPDVLWHLLLALTAVVIVGRLLGRLFSLIGQPPVIGEVVAGILLGPSLLGLVSIGLVSGWYMWLICGLIVAVATAGKFGGTLIAARATGLPWRQAAGLGVLMNTRGLMELIVLNVGLELGVISPTLFTMLVLMALVTTLATTPILRRLLLS